MAYDGQGGYEPLEKIVYLADTIEPTRSFTGVEEIRSLAYSDIDGALARSFELSSTIWKSAAFKPDRSTVEALEYLKNERVKRP
jgi:HD superfamily phosphohydrolase YqeK